MPHETSYGRYGVPSEQQCGRIDDFSLSSDGNAEMYASSNSLVLRNDGRTVHTIPEMASTHTVNSCNGGYRSHLTSCSEDQIPLSLHCNPTPVISENTYQPYNTAFKSSNLAMTPGSPMSRISMDHHPNEMYASDILGANVFWPTLSGTGFPTDLSYRSCDVELGQRSGEASHMVTGILGADDGRMGLNDEILQLMDQFDLPLPQCDRVPVFEGETNLGDLLRKLEEPIPSSSSSRNLVHQRELEAFQDMPFDFLSTTICSDYLGEPIQAQPRDKFVSESHSWNGSLEPIQQKGAIEDDLDLIKLMRTKAKPPLPLNLKQVSHGNHVLEHVTDTEKEGVVFGTSVSIKAESITLSKSLAGPFSPCPVAPHNVTNYGIQTQTPVSPIQASTPFPGPPHMSVTPATPVTAYQSLRKGPFEINSYNKRDKHIIEVTISNDVPNHVKKVAYNMNDYSFSLCREYKSCMSKDFDLNMAISARAELCDFVFDREMGKLTFSMPVGCIHLDQWIRAHQGEVDLLDRQLVLQQVANLLATIHSISSPEKLCLWGSFVVWVSPSKQVYVLVDFPEMLAKMEINVHKIFDPRVEDVMALYGLYKSILQPFINHASSWVSPAVKNLLRSFEALISDPSSVYRMAELARTLGERRLCKLEVEIVTISHYVYCIEHEPLCKVLSHFGHMLPQVPCDRWEVQWANSDLPVTQDVMASAQRCMRLRFAPITCTKLPFFKTEQHVLGFKQNEAV